MARYLTHPSPPFQPKKEEEEDDVNFQPAGPELRGMASKTEGINDVEPYIETGLTKIEQDEIKLCLSGMRVKKEEEDTDVITQVKLKGEQQRPSIDTSNNGKAEDEAEEDLWKELDLVHSHGVETQPSPSNPRRTLPEAIDDERTCKKCYAADGCMLYRRAVDKVTTLSDDSMQQVYDDRTAHLTDEQCEFFEKWERLISLEEREMVRFKKEIWNMTALERQKYGRCFANMAVDPTYERKTPAKDAKPAIQRFFYRMVRSNIPLSSNSNSQDTLTRPHIAQASCSSTSVSNLSLLSGQISIGDPVVVSIEPSVLGLARGCVLELQPEYVILGLDHSLTTLPGNRHYDCPTSENAKNSMIYRIDKDELQSGMGRIRDNLAQVFYAKGDKKRLRLVVDLEKPKFDTLVPFSYTKKADVEGLNSDQINAVNKVLTAQDYALILGMPGTGKTTTIAEIIKALTDRGKSVLLTSYTHSAVDNILLKIKDLDIKILRLGNTDRVTSSTPTY